MRKHARPSPLPLPLRERGLPRPDAAFARRLADMFGLLSSPTRLRILQALFAAEELHVQGLADALRMRVTAVSNQLRLMAIMGILSARADRLRTLYAVKAPWVRPLVDAAAALARNRG
ncbi:MAG: helix-turn-helix transcriptional regulator [Planctomycetia bacterium]|nr:helix-turn-helix transcriptional regulator [Planctomycetia bacterium]